MRLVAKTFHGLENVLAAELVNIGAENVKLLKRAVEFEGDINVLYKANLWSRTALKILLPITTFKARNENELYKKVKEFDWSKILSNEQTLAVDSVVFSNYFKHSKFVALKVKDAICDRFVSETGKRPSVNLEQPDLLLNVHVVEDTFTLSADSSGLPLNRRGYRTKDHPSPINESLAAGMVLISGWNGKSNFLDPMCGSGTIVLEATMIAANIAPNHKRSEFGFMKWKNYDPKLWDKIKRDAEAGIKTPEVKICGSDIAVWAIDIARRCALDFGLKKYIDFTVTPFNETRKPGKEGTLIMNPPYDERLRSSDIVKLYSETGSYLKKNYSGWDAWVISSNLEALKLIGLKPVEKQTLFNGSLECKFLKFAMYEGSKKISKSGISSEV